MSEQLTKKIGSELGCMQFILIIIAIALMAHCSNSSRIADSLEKIEGKMR